MSRCTAIERNVHLQQAQGREHEDHVFALKTSLQSSIHQLDASMQGMQSDLRALKSAHTVQQFHAYDMPWRQQASQSVSEDAPSGASQHLALA